MKNFCLILILSLTLFSCASMKPSPKKAYICINAYQSVNDAPHEFLNLTATELRYEYPDTVMFERGDTVNITTYWSFWKGRRVVFETFKN